MRFLPDPKISYKMEEINIFGSKVALRAMESIVRVMGISIKLQEKLLHVVDNGQWVAVYTGY